MEEVISFDKSYQQRFHDYAYVFAETERISVSQIRELWVCYVQLTVDQGGWQAIWKIPRMTCETLKIQFPAFVLVYVEELKVSELCALVKVLTTQDEDVHLPDKHIIPLHELFPTMQQDDSVVLNLTSTAEALDMLRFFYNHLLMPWDYDEDDGDDWSSKHMESRLHFFYDMKNGLIPKSMTEHVRGLMSEARQLQTKREQFDMKLDESDDDFSPENETLLALMDVHVRMIEIGNEVKILENPILRQAVLRKQKQTAVKTTTKTETWMVFEHGKPDDYISFLNQIKLVQTRPSRNVRFAPRLQFLLDTIAAVDTVFLSRSRHVINGEGTLHNGGSLIGLYHRNDTVLASKNEKVMLDFGGEEVVLENLTIDANCAQCGILVRRGTVTLNNCKLTGDGETSTHQGIIVLSGSTLNLINCDISGFAIGIVANTGSKISLRNCELSGLDVGIKLHKKCGFEATACALRNCRYYGVCVETRSGSGSDDEEGGRVSGSFTDLQRNRHDIVLKGLVGEGNGKGDVVFNSLSRLNPLRDLFSKADLNPSLIEYDSGDNESYVENGFTHTLDNTVIENEYESEQVMDMN